MNSLDGPYCRHGVNAFDPTGCPQCTAEYDRRRAKPVTHANGHVPVSSIFKSKEFQQPESD